MEQSAFIRRMRNGEEKKRKIVKSFFLFFSGNPYGDFIARFLFRSGNDFR